MSHAHSLSLALVAALAAPTAILAQDCKLSTDVTRVSVSAGGTQMLYIDVGPSNAGLYYVLGSFSGTSPGFDLGMHYPLNMDRYLIDSWVGVLRLAPGGGIGATDALGHGAFALVVPSGTLTALAGLSVHHAVAPQSQVTLLHTCVTNPVRLQLVP